MDQEDVCPRCQAIHFGLPHERDRLVRCRACGHEFRFGPTWTHEPAATMASSARGAPVVGTLFHGRYLIEGELGRGGMGIVYLARDRGNDDRAVALKTILGAVGPDSSSLRRFGREIAVAASLAHENICPILDSGEAAGLPYYTMPRIAGRTLAEADRPAVERALVIVRSVASALDHAHAKGVIHRDLKPSNVMIDDSGRAVLMDFGVARVGDPDGRPLTRTGDMVGTPGYASPEQIEGDSRAIGPATDVFGLGAIFYELLAGRRPFRSIAETLMADPEPPLPSRPRLGAVCLKALAKRREDRFATMAELIAALDAAETAATLPGRLNITVPGKWSSRSAGKPGTKWTEVGRTPAILDVAPGYASQLCVLISATDEELAGLGDLNGLSSLSLAGCARITDDGLAGLSALESLRELNLWGCKGLTDATLARIGGLVDLEEMNLSWCARITDEGLLRMGGLRSLRSLSLAWCVGLTDAGIAHLAGLEALRSIDLSGCDGLTDAGLAAFRASRPDCPIRR